MTENEETREDTAQDAMPGAGQQTVQDVTLRNVESEPAKKPAQDTMNDAQADSLIDGIRTHGMPEVPVVAVILAAGFGTRFDPDNPKQLVSISGTPVIAWSIQVFEECPEVTDVVVVVNPRVYDEVEHIADDMNALKVRALVPGGETRTDSTLAALKFLEQQEIPGNAKVLIHDGVRPFTRPKTVHECIAALDHVNAATVAVPSTDTILLAQAGDDGTPFVHAVPDRSAAWRAQTPQCFRFDTIRRAYELAAADEGFHPTDDTRVVIDYLPGEPVAIVEGSADNIKITTPTDIEIAQSIAPRARRARLSAKLHVARYNFTHGIDPDATDEEDSGDIPDGADDGDSADISGDGNPFGYGGMPEDSSL